MKSAKDIVKMVITGKGLYDQEPTVCGKDHNHHYLRMTEPCDCGRDDNAKAK